MSVAGSGELSGLANPFQSGEQPAGIPMRTVPLSKGGCKFVWLKTRPSLSTQKHHAGRRPVSPGGQVSVSSLSPVVGTQAQGPDSPGITVCPPHAGETWGAAFLHPGGAPKCHPTKHRDSCTFGHSPSWCVAAAVARSLGSTGRARRHQSAHPNLPTSWPQEPDLREQSSSQ